jgi:hypothetical protein
MESMGGQIINDGSDPSSHLQATSPMDSATTEQQPHTFRGVTNKVIRHMKGVDMNTTVQKSRAFGDVKDFGHLLHLYRTSSDPPPLPCPWSTCDFVTQEMGMKDGKPVGSGPHIDIRLLELHVEYHGVHSRSDLAYMTFTILKNMIQLFLCWKRCIVGQY